MPTRGCFTGSTFGLRPTGIPRVYQLDSLPGPELNFPGFWAIRTRALSTGTAWGWAGPAPPRALHRAPRASHQAATAPPPPPSPKSKPSPPRGLARPGSSMEEEELGGRRTETWARRRLEAGEGQRLPSSESRPRPPESVSAPQVPGQPSPTPGEVVSVRLGGPRSPARAGAVGGWVSAVGLFLALHTLCKSGASALQAPARSLRARTPGPDTGAEEGTGWGPRGVRRRGGAGEAGAPGEEGALREGPRRQAAFNPRRPAPSPAPRAQPPPRTPPGTQGAGRRRAQPLPMVVMTVMAK